MLVAPSSGSFCCLSNGLIAKCTEDKVMFGSSGLEGYFFIGMSSVFGMGFFCMVFWVMYLLISSQNYEDLRIYSLSKMCPFHALCRTVHRLEKSTPPPVVANMSYEKQLLGWVGSTELLFDQYVSRKLFYEVCWKLMRMSNNIRELWGNKLKIDMFRSWPKLNI